MRTRRTDAETPEAAAPRALTGAIGRRGAFVIPAALRRKYGLTAGQSVIIEEHEDGVLIRREQSRRLDDQRRREILQETAKDYDALAAVPEVWQEMLAERASMEGTLMDGLDPAESWSEADFVTGGRDSEGG